MKLTLNAPALERLLGGDTELEVALKHQIVDNFAKHHLKKLINDGTWRAAYAKIEGEVQAEIQKHLVQLDVFGRVQSKLNSELKDLIRTEIYNLIQEQTKKIVAEQRSYIGPDIKKAVDHALKVQVNELVQQGVREQMAAIAEAAAKSVAASKTQ